MSDCNTYTNEAVGRITDATANRPHFNYAVLKNVIYGGYRGQFAIGVTNPARYAVRASSDSGSTWTDWKELAAKSDVTVPDCTRLTVGSVSDGTAFKARHSFTLPAGVWFVSVGMPWGSGRPDKYAIADNESTFVNVFTSTTDNYYVHNGVIRTTAEKTYWVWASLSSSSGNIIFDLLKVKVGEY